MPSVVLMTWIARVGRETEYLLVGLPVAVLSFALLLALFIAGTVTSAVLLGLPLLVLALLVARGFADVQRLRLERLQGEPIAPPTYRPADPGARWFRRLIAPLRQGQAWLDLLHGIFGLIPALIGFVFAVVWWAMALGGLTYPITSRFVPDDEENPVVKAVLGADTEA